MQPLDLNLATRPFRNNTLLWLGYGAALALLVAFTVSNVETYREHRRLVTSLIAQTGDFDTRREELTLRDQRVRKGINAHDLTSLAIQADKANEVIRWKAFSWTRLFNRLESIQPWEVRMTSINPVFRAERRFPGGRDTGFEETAVPVTVEGAAKDLRAFLEFERALIFDPHFSSVHPEQTGRDDVTGETVFSLQFLYDPVVDESLTAEAEADDEQAEAPARGAEAAGADEPPVESAAGKRPADGLAPRGRAAATSGDES